MAASQGAPLTRDVISQKANCCQKTITRCIALFKRAGLIEVVANHCENGGQIANSYITTAAARNLLSAYNSRFMVNCDQKDSRNHKQESNFSDSSSNKFLYPSP